MSNAPRDWTVLSMMEWGTDYFRKKGIPDPRYSIEWLLAEVLEIKRLDLYLKYDRPLTSRELDELRPLVKRRATHEPLQYILGFSEFMNARITVNSDVLIPRIETEQLVEIILDDFPEREEEAGLRALDIGTGSGCIPIALKMERPAWEMTSFDISENALILAQKNAVENGADITFLQGDILNQEELGIEGPFDLIVSNPPYILPEEKETLEKQVAEYEPSLALFSDDLQNMYGSVVRYSEKNLVKNGSLYLEVHEHHAQEIRELFDEDKWDAAIHEDYSGKPRFIIAEKQI